MRFVLSLILLAFSTVSFAAEVKIIRGTGHKSGEASYMDGIKEPVPEKIPEKSKAQEMEEIILPAVNHCLKIESMITAQPMLIRAFNQPLESELMLPDFGFVFGQEWTITTRAPRTKLNAIMLLQLSEDLGFKPAGYKFGQNCRASVSGKLEKENGFTYVKIKTPLAFDTNEAELIYLMEKQDGYNWMIGDISVNGKSVAKYNSGNLESTIKSLCATSSFGTLDCGSNLPESGQ